MGKLTSKGKYTVKVGNHPHTNISKPGIMTGGEYKCRVSKMCLKLGDQGLKTSMYKYRLLGASLVAQWLRICLLMQGTRVRALVWEDPTCRGATRPVSHNY